MKYQKPSFTVPASAGKKETCEKEGHAFADTKGRCVRCSERIRPDPFASKPQHDLDAMKNGRKPAA
jgi:hypothetical protein